jgi:hypothetical protein
MRFLFSKSLLRVTSLSRSETTARWFHYNGKFGIPVSILVFQVTRTICSTFIAQKFNIRFLAMPLSSSSSSSSTRQAEVNMKEGLVEQTIREKLMNALSPVTHLSILNESHRHNVYVRVRHSLHYC